MVQHDPGTLTCPRCGENLETVVGAVAADAAIAGDEVIRVEVGCSACDAPLAVVVESEFASASGVDVWVEDRRDDG